MKKNLKLVYIIASIVVVLVIFFVGKSILNNSKLNGKMKIIAYPDKTLVEEAKQNNNDLIAIYLVHEEKDKLDVKVVLPNESKNEGKAIEINEVYTFGRENKLNRKVIYSNVYAAELAQENNNYEGIKSTLEKNVITIEEQKITESKEQILNKIKKDCENNNLYFKILDK